MTNTTTGHIKYATVTVPAYAHFSAERLIEARCGAMTSGLCRSVEEAQTRIEALVSGEPTTQAPGYQANEQEMAAAWARLQTVDLREVRDGGMCYEAVAAALAAGIHSTAWAIASRYLVAGWI
jgi:hypothetical protein